MCKPHYGWTDKQSPGHQACRVLTMNIETFKFGSVSDGQETEIHEFFLKF